jgi:hypothetical protein
MENQQLNEFIKKALEKGHTEQQVEQMLVSKGWDKVIVNQAILDSKFGTQELTKSSEQFKEEKHKSKKKLWINIVATIILFIFIGMILFSKLQTPTGKSADLVNNSILKNPFLQDLAWCTENEIWSDQSISEEDPLIIRGLVAVGKKSICHASSDSAQELGYQFTQNNKEIWKLEYTQAPWESSQQIITSQKIN